MGFEIRWRDGPHSGQNLNDALIGLPHAVHLSDCVNVRDFLTGNAASAMRISPAVAKRSCGCFASAFATIASRSLETCSRREVSDGIIAFKWFARISVVEPAKNGVLYASSSYRMIPTA